MISCIWVKVSVLYILGNECASIITQGGGTAIRVSEVQVTKNQTKLELTMNFSELQLTNNFSEL